MSHSNLPKWNLNDLYSSLDDPKISSDLEKYKQLNIDLADSYKGKLVSISATQFVKSLAMYEKITTLSNILMDYAYLNMVTQMKNDKAMSFYQDMTEKMTDYSVPAIFYSLEINQLSDDKINELLENTDVAYYKPFITSLRMFKDYSLSQDIEEILHEKSITSSSAWVRLYEETSAHLEYTVDGKSYNDAEISKLLQDRDASIRAKAGVEINRVSHENSMLFSFVYNMIIKDKSISDNKRGFSAPISSKNLENNVEAEVVEALASAVKANYSTIAHRFYKLKAKWLGVEKLGYWDRNAPLPFSAEKIFSWEESVEIVQDAYNKFSPNLYDLSKDFFDKNWIDVPPRDGKRSGAFAAPVSATLHPYLLLNFVGKQNDVLTLAHELGHGCHQLLSGTKGELNDATPLTLAEVASVFGEMMTFQSMLDKIDDDKEKLCLIASKVSDMINTAIRQISFHFFESRAHEERKSGELSNDRLCEIWTEEMKSALGDSVIVGDDSKYIWSQVGHFYFAPFYVYAYSFADCLVNSLYQVYQEGAVDSFEEKYLDMLANTGVKKYDELLMPFGLDAKDEGFWQKGLSLISKYLDQLEELDKKLGL